MLADEDADASSFVHGNKDLAELIKATNATLNKFYLAHGGGNKHIDNDAPSFVPQQAEHGGNNSE